MTTINGSREFSKVLKALCPTKKDTISPALIALLPVELKARIVNYIVSRRQPLVVDFIGAHTELSWLHAMGYLDYVKGNKFTFLCTCENKHRINNTLIGAAAQA